MSVVQVSVYHHNVVYCCGDDDFIDVLVKVRCMQSLHQ